MKLWDRLRSWWGTSRPKPLPHHLQRGRLGELAARRHLEAAGLTFLTANFRTQRGEIDLVFRDRHCLVFVEVKTRSPGGWTRPAAAINASKKRRLSRAALDYLRQLDQPRVPFRFDVVEVIACHEEILEIRHLPSSFALSQPYRYG